MLGFSLTVVSNSMLAACIMGKAKAMLLWSPRDFLTGLIRLVDSSTGPLNVDMTGPACRQLSNSQDKELNVGSFDTSMLSSE